MYTFCSSRRDASNILELEKLAHPPDQLPSLSVAKCRLSVVRSVKDKVPSQRLTFLKELKATRIYIDNYWIRDLQFPPNSSVMYPKDANQEE